jgi:membrane-associated phospholipid phosphatase
MAGKSKRLSRRQKWFVISILAFYDIAMLVSRIYLGEHWLSDIIGGSILGISMGLFAVLFL